MTIRRGFLLGLLGAVVAKAQQRSTSVKIQSNLDPKELQRKSGYCPLDGTKGEPYGYLIADPTEAVSWMNYVLAAARGEAAPTVTVGVRPSLRCPHCGMLFTETKPCLHKY